MASDNQLVPNPKKGHVKEVCKKWLVHEDGALAQKLQSEEIKEYYIGNKVRNAIVREDFPRALEISREEEERAKEMEKQYRRWLKAQEDNDRLLAEEVENYLRIEKLRDEEVESNKAKEFARRLQRMEQNAEEERIKKLQAEADEAERLAQMMQLKDQEEKLTQTERDRLMAIKTQNEELAEEDRLIAIQAQDEELARMLQEREKKRAKRLKEKYRLKKQQNSLRLQDHSSQGIQDHSSQADEISTLGSVAANYEISDTYVNPCDFLPKTRNPNNSAQDNVDFKFIKDADDKMAQSHLKIQKDEASNNFDYQEDDALYALPIEVQQVGYNHNLPDPLRELKPKPLKSLQKETTLFKRDLLVAHNDQLSFSHKKGNELNSPNTPTSTTSSLENSLEFNNGENSKKKKEKKEKCTHQ